MARFCPAYPTPRRNKASGLLMFLSARHSWLDALYERSYRMQMGEVRLPASTSTWSTSPVWCGG